MTVLRDLARERPERAREILRATLEEHRWDFVEAAKELGVSRDTLRRALRDIGALEEFSRARRMFLDRFKEPKGRCEDR